MELSRSSRSRTPSRASSTASRSARAARCSSTSAAGRPTSRWCARAGSRARGCSRSAAGRSRSRIADRLELPFPRAEALKVDYARGIAGDRRGRGREIVADDVAVWAAGVELVMEELAARRPAAGPDLPVRRRLAAAGDPRALAQRLVRRAAAVRAPAGGGDPVAGPDRDDARRHTLLEDQQDVTPMGLAYQAIELGSRRTRSMRRSAGSSGR